RGLWHRLGAPRRCSERPPPASSPGRATPEVYPPSLHDALPISVEARTARQWSVFYAYTAWSVVLILAIFPLGVLLAFGAAVPALLAEAPTATAVLLVQIVLGAWSGHRALALWSASALPEARDRWDLPQVGRIPVDSSLLATAVPSAVIVLLQLFGHSAVPVLAASLSLLAAAAFLRWRWQIGAAAAVAATVVAMAFGISAPAAFP